MTLVLFLAAVIAGALLIQFDLRLFALYAFSVLLGLILRGSTLRVQREIDLDTLCNL